MTTAHKDLPALPEDVNTPESIAAATGTMQDFADAGDLVDKLGQCKTKGDMLGLVLSYRRDIRAALARPEPASTPVAVDYQSSDEEDWDMAMETAQAAPQGQQSKMECDLCGVDRSTDPCPGMADECGMPSDAHLSGTIDPTKALYWFNCLSECAKLLELPDNEPIPSGVVAAVVNMVAKS